jgi:hypothetical protein
LLGKAHFEALNCFTCHGGETFTDSSLGTLHDVGTLLATSGQRLGDTLTGLDTPTLKGIWATTPYLHDGSAPTLRDVLTTKNPSDTHGAVSTLTNDEIDELLAYLQQIDESEPAALAFTGINANTFANYVQTHGLTGNDALPGTDPDKDGWSNEAEFTIGGTNPNSGNDRPQLVSAISSEATESYLELSWLRHEGGSWNPQGYLWGQFQYSPRGSTDLDTWDLELITIPNPDGLPAAPTGYEWTTSRIASPMSVMPKAFVQLLVGE